MFLLFVDMWLYSCCTILIVTLIMSPIKAFLKLIIASTNLFWSRRSHVSFPTVFLIMAEIRETLKLFNGILLITQIDHKAIDLFTRK